MAKNADGKKDADDTRAAVTEEDLRKDKYGADGVDTSDKDEDETDSDDESDDDGADGKDGEDNGDESSDDDTDSEDSEDDSDEDSDDDERFVKEFDNIKGDTLPEYARNLEKTLRLSQTEALRLVEENKQLKAKDTAVGDDGKSDDKKPPVEKDPIKLFMKQKMDEEIQTAYLDFSKDYNQVDDPGEYNKFTKTVGQLARTIQDSEGRIASPRELYSKAAVILEWEPVDKKPTDAEKVGIAVKARAGQTIAGSGGSKKPKAKSKVTQAMVELNRKMYPGKTDAQIRTELEPYA